MYIWERTDWHGKGDETSSPAFQWQIARLQPLLNQIRQLQGRLLGQSDLLEKEADLQAQLDALLQSALQTSEIEGEVLNAGSVRCSIAVCSNC